MKELAKEVLISLLVVLVATLIYGQAAFDWVGNLINYYGGLV